MKGAVRNGEQDCTWIDLYNQCLLARYERHMNAEAYATITATNHLYNYTYKGPDRACAKIGGTR